MADINVKANVQRTSTLGKVRILVEQVVGSPSQAQINQAVADYIDSHPGSLSPLSQATKSALLDIAAHVAYIDANGQSRYDALDAALNAKALLSITAVYTQSGAVYDTDSLDSLKSDLVVTANYDDGTTADVTSACTLSGTLAEGTSTITATYGGKSATFNVIVSTEALPTVIEIEGNNKAMNESAAVGTSFDGCKTTNNNRFRTVNPVAVKRGDVINFSISNANDTLGIYYLWFDENQNYTGVHTSAWDYTGEFTVNQDYPYIGFGMRTKTNQSNIAYSGAVLTVTITRS